MPPPLGYSTPPPPSRVPPHQPFDLPPARRLFANSTLADVSRSSGAASSNRAPSNSSTLVDEASAWDASLLGLPPSAPPSAPSTPPQAPGTSLDAFVGGQGDRNRFRGPDPRAFLTAPPPRNNFEFYHNTMGQVEPPPLTRQEPRDPRERFFEITQSVNGGRSTYP